MTDSTLLKPEEQRSKRFYETAKIILILVSAVSSLIVIFALVVAVGELQKVTESTNNSADLLVDCTTPQGKCYQNSNARTGEAVGSINRVSIYAAYCSKIPSNQTVDQIESCIRQELERDKK